jgi:hypothetical protein
MNLNDLIPGVPFVYYRGNSIAKGGGYEERNTAFEMYQCDEAHLTQRRLSDGQYEYIITRNRLSSRPAQVKKRREYAASLKDGLLVTRSRRYGFKGE